MILAQTILLYLPAYVANMFPVLAAKCSLPFGKPINEGLFGKNKTRRGFYSGLIGSYLSIYLLRFMQNSGREGDYFLLIYNHGNILFLAAVFTLGALGGDLVKSYFKRKKGIRSGKKRIPFDQLDLIVGTNLVLIPFIKVPISIVVLSIVLTFIGHLMVNLIAYKLGLKDVRR